MTFEVVDKTTSIALDYKAIENLALRIGDNLIYCDIEGFALFEDGQVILCDECGNWAYVNMEKENLKLVFKED
jgi:hypothetical protein